MRRSTGCTRCNAHAATTCAQSAEKWCRKRTRKSTKRMRTLQWSASTATSQQCNTSSATTKNIAKCVRKSAPTAAKCSKWRSSLNIKKSAALKLKNAMVAAASSWTNNANTIWLVVNANFSSKRTSRKSSVSNSSASMTWLNTKLKKPSAEKKKPQRSNLNSRGKSHQPALSRMCRRPILSLLLPDNLWLLLDRLLPQSTMQGKVQALDRAQALVKWIRPPRSRQSPIQRTNQRLLPILHK